jgi:hypothetical protein
MSVDLNMVIGYEVQNTAEWRREKAKQFPDDTRNLRAAEELERLAAQIEQLEGSAIHERVRALYDRYRAAANGSVDIYEDVSAELSQRLRDRRAIPRMVLRSARG